MKYSDNVVAAVKLLQAEHDLKFYQVIQDDRWSLVFLEQMGKTINERRLLRRFHSNATNRINKKKTRLSQGVQFLDQRRSLNKRDKNASNRILKRFEDI